jgi:hypothetical protein
VIGDHVPTKTPGQPVVAGKALGKGQVGSAKEELNWVLEKGSSLKEEAAQNLAQLQ